MRDWFDGLTFASCFRRNERMQSNKKVQEQAPGQDQRHGVRLGHPQIISLCRAIPVRGARLDGYSWTRSGAEYKPGIDLVIQVDYRRGH
jgi:hypothetical protein